MALASGANIFVCMGSNPISVNLFFAILALQWMHMRLCYHVHFFVVVGHIAKALGHHDHVGVGFFYVSIFFFCQQHTFFTFPPPTPPTPCH